MGHPVGHLNLVIHHGFSYQIVPSFVQQEMHLGEKLEAAFPAAQKYEVKTGKDFILPPETESLES